MDTTLFIMTLITGWFAGVTTVAIVLAVLIYKDDKKNTARRVRTTRPSPEDVIKHHTHQH